MHDRAEVGPGAPGEAKRARPIAGRYVRPLQFCGGGWAYYDFLGRDTKPSDDGVQLHHCHGADRAQAGRIDRREVPRAAGKKAIASIHRQQNPDFSYDYGEYLRFRPMHPINRPGGSLGRSQACNLALRMWGDQRITDDVVKTWLDRLFARNGWLSMGRKRPIPHESFFYVAGYFYYYGHWHAALCIDLLPAAERPYFQDHLAHIILPLQEQDGSWWDFPLYNYHQQYGTVDGGHDPVALPKAVALNGTGTILLRRLPPMCRPYVPKPLPGVRSGHAVAGRNKRQTGSISEHLPPVSSANPAALGVWSDRATVPNAAP